MTYHAKIVAGGKISLPADLRRALGLKDGDTLVFEQDGDAMRVRSFDAVIRDVQEWAKQYPPQSGMLASDELSADRRAEAAREAAKDAEWLARQSKRRT